MRNIVRVIGVSLAAMAGSLMVAGVAWAQAVETPITVRFIDWGCEWGEPERVWVDEDGIEHGRDLLISCPTRRDMFGTIAAWNSWDFDPAAGHLIQNGYYSFVGTLLGEPTTAVGRFTGEGDRIEGVWTYTREDVMHLAGGGLVKLSGTWEAGERIILSGTLLDPPGGESRQGPRPRR
jgi:hypothetical protein